MKPWLLGVVFVAGACEPEADPSYGETDDERGRPTVYVDASAPDGGTGTSWKKAFQTVEEGVAAACDIGGRPTVRIAPGEYTGVLGDPARDETNILVRCPMTISGETQLTRGANHLPNGFEEDDVTRISVRLLQPAAGQPGQTIFKVIASDVTIEGLVLEGGYGGVLFSQLIEVAGVRPADGRPTCPSGPLTNVTIREVALMGAGQAVQSYGANTTLVDVYATDNLIGFTLLGGYDSANVSTGVWNSTLSGNSWYGGCLFPTAAGFVPSCPPDPTNTTPTANHVVVFGSEFSDNGYASASGVGNLAGSGLRIISLAAGQPDAPGRLELLSVGTRYTDNRAYGWASDMPAGQIGRLTHAMEHHVVSLGDEVDGNGRNAGFIGFRIVNQSLTLPLTTGIYATGSKAEFVTWPDHGFDHENPAVVGTTTLNNTAIVNGEHLVLDSSITPGL